MSEVYLQRIVIGPCNIYKKVTMQPCYGSRLGRREAQSVDLEHPVVIATFCQDEAVFSEETDMEVVRNGVKDNCSCKDGSDYLFKLLS